MRIKIVHPSPARACRLPLGGSSPQAQSPYIAVARIVVPPQPADPADSSELGDDRLAFSPWHGVAAHRPIGSIMRVRKSAYEASKEFRATHNNCPIHEPR